ncbi:hypothetical protein ACFOD4_18875 [Pseudoroseomonas globiformis]|uniref:Uncharacterized protein n=1 Tax=Teichococcus globiformis TaxID=2307229 RepID=A0ABV7G938_9PROT
MRKPNYNFERSQRDNAKRAKTEAKLQKKREQASEQKEPELKEAHPEDEVRGGQEVPEE